MKHNAKYLFGKLFKINAYHYFDFLKKYSELGSIKGNR